jgi:hypothetical protein
MIVSTQDWLTRAKIGCFSDSHWRHLGMNATEVHNLKPLVALSVVADGRSDGLAT